MKRWTSGGPEVPEPGGPASRRGMGIFAHDDFEPMAQRLGNDWLLPIGITCDCFDGSR